MEHPAQREPKFAPLSIEAIAPVGVDGETVAQRLSITQESLRSQLANVGALCVSETFALARAIGIQPSALIERAEAT